MSPIVDLQRHNREDGRIRFGHKVGTTMKTLDKPRLTSADRDLLEKVAKVHGGEVREWAERDGEYELFVESESLPFLIEVGPEPFSQWWERWSGAGCLRRCDGITDTIHEKPCDCDKDGGERACKPTSRIGIMLPETGEALWRAESKSLHAALDIPGDLEAAIAESKTGEVIAGVLSIGHKPGKRGKVPVPQFRLATNGGGKVPAAPEPEPSPKVKLVTRPQIVRMFAVASDSKVPEETVKKIIANVAGVESSKEIPADKYDAVIDAIAQEALDLDAAHTEEAPEEEPLTGQVVLEKLKSKTAASDPDAS